MSADFIRAIHEAGIPINDEIITDGKLHRAHVDGDKAGTRNAWYVLHDGNYPAGAFGCNKRGISGKWRADQKSASFTQADRDRFEQERHARAEAQERTHSDAAIRARQMLEQATRDATEHAYIVRKGIQPHTVRVNGYGLLVIPIYSASTGKLQTVQMIDADGNKKMLTDGRVSGGCFPFADMPDFWVNAEQRIGICEGYATGATLAETLPTVAMFAAFSAGNLLAVATALRVSFPDAKITLYADNDVNQIGQRYASAAATAIDGLVAIPPIAGCDWNDMRGAA